MAGDRKAYQTAMNAGSQAAWDQQWERAIEAYQRAIEEFPEDPTAYISIGLALLQTGQLKDALDAYQRAHVLAPNDPIPLERSADVLERMGQLQGAAENYIKVADIFLGRRDVAKTIGNWERAARLAPGMLNIHARLAQAYERTNRRKAAIREYLTIAAVFQRKGDTNRAIEACKRALRLDRNNPQVLNSLQALQAGQKMRAPEAKPKLDVAKAKQAIFGGSFLQEKEEEKPPPSAETSLKGPTGEAQENALADLATHLFGAGIATQPSGMHAAKAIDLQRAGELGAAINAYRSAAEAGLDYPAFALNYGSLLVEYGEYQTGIDVLKGALNHRDFAAGAYFASAQAYMALNDQRETVRHLLSALRLVDTGEPAQPGSSNKDLYAEMLRSAATMSEDRLSALNQSLLAFMTGPDWKRNVAQTRSQLEEATQMAGEGALLEMLATDQTGRIAAIMSRIDTHRREDKNTLAMDEAYYAIQLAPNYLPAHIRVAELLLKENRTRPAIQKYNMVAEVYRARGDNAKAAEILNELLKMAPMDISVRRRRIQWLEEEERWRDVLDEYVSLADTHYQLADWDGAREAYEEARLLAERTEASTDKLVHILHRVADIDVQRLDLRAAIDTYKQIKRLDANEEKSRRALIDLAYRLGNNADAIVELDDLLRLYARTRRADQIEKILVELVTLHPDDMGLRSRLARVYQQQRRVKETVAQLDALGELQLEAGRQDEAIQTIQRIVAMNPPDRENYEALLRKLAGQ